MAKAGLYEELDRKALTDVLEAKRADIARFRDNAIKFEDHEGKRSPKVGSQEDVKALQQAVADAEQIKGILDHLDRAAGIDKYLDEPGYSAAGAADAEGAQRKGLVDVNGVRLDRKTLGEMFTDSAAYKQMMESGATQTPFPFKLGVKNIGRLMVATVVEELDPEARAQRKGYEAGYDLIERKDIYTAAGGSFTIPGFGGTQNDGIVIPAYRTTRVRDLFPSDTTTNSTITFIRRTGYVNNARIVAERTAADGSAATGLATDVFGLKPPSNLTYTPDEVSVRTIAHVIDVSKTVLDDEPRLQSTINGEMLYGLRLTEDAELLYGDGSANHLSGILTTEGIQLYDAATGPAGDYYSDSVRRALTLVQLAYYESTGVVLHPFDWEAMELEKDDFGRYVLVTNVAVGAEKTVWTNPVVATPAMQQGSFLVGAFGLGAKLWDREQANIAVSTETRDLFDRNASAIRCEERLALEVSRPEAFVKGTFGAPPAS